MYNYGVGLKLIYRVEWRDNMAISYNKLWKLLIDKKMTTAELRKTADIAPNTLTRMKRDQEVTLQVFERICEVLQVDFGEIMEYIPNKY